MAFSSLTLTLQLSLISNYEHGNGRGHEREEWKREGQFKPKEKSGEPIKYLKKNCPPPG